ncbi:MAG TPA: hypothetical protein VID72_05900 [Ktedonobacterales bacterium]
MIAQTTPTTTSTNRTAVSRLEVAGILLMMAGDGYINGNFIQPINVGWGVFIDIVHFIPLAILLWLGAALLRTVDEADAATNRRRGLRVGVTIMAVLATITSLVMIGLGAFVPSLGVGVQAFSDWLAVILAGGGAVLWFVTLFLARRA